MTQYKKAKNYKMLISSLKAAAIAIPLGLSAASCAPQVSYHGHVFTDEEIKQIKPGMSQAQVKLALGSPATTSAIGGGAYYYISSKQQKSMTFLRPSVTDRKVLAVYFNNETAEVERVSNYGLKDGQIIDFNDRTTKSYKGDDTIISNIFKGIGRRRMFDQSPAQEE
ncbi:MAG: outer membrane protein assembly factor BamE [Pseudomonadota bacterium]